MAASLFLLVLPARPPEVQGLLRRTSSGMFMLFDRMHNSFRHSIYGDFQSVQNSLHSGATRDPIISQENKSSANLEQFSVDAESFDAQDEVHGRDDGYEPVIGWSAIQKLNWDIIFLLGGGFALSLGFEVSGYVISPILNNLFS